MFAESKYTSNSFVLKVNNIGGRDNCAACGGAMYSQLAEIFLAGTFRPVCGHCAGDELLKARDEINAFEVNMDEPDIFTGELPTDDDVEKIWWLNIGAKVEGYNFIRSLGGDWGSNG